jgi:hypothetical protein
MTMWQLGPGRRAILPLIAIGFATLAAGAQAATPTMSTTANPSQLPAPGPAADTATLSAGTAPTGTITFSLYGADDRLCDNPPIFTSVAPVAGNGPYTSGSFTPPADQSAYRWVASYSGDANNTPVADVCNADSHQILVVGVIGNGIGLGGGPDWPTSAKVGDTVTANYTMVNLATTSFENASLCNAADAVPGGLCAGFAAPPPGWELLDDGMVVVIACATFPNASGRFANCPAGSAEPGVFRVHPVATGHAGTACGGMTFDVTVIDPATDTVRLTPTAGRHVVLANVLVQGILGDRRGLCTIDYQADVLRVPSQDSNPGVAGVQTNHIGYGESRAAQGGITAGSKLTATASGSSRTTILPAATPPPPTSQPTNAVLNTPGACPKRSASISVTGSQIDKVTFFVNGKKVATDDKAPFATKVKIGKLSFGSHAVKAVVDFTAASGKAGDTFTGRIVRCRPPKPKFTG